MGFISPNTSPFAGLASACRMLSESRRFVMDSRLETEARREVLLSAARLRNACSNAVSSEMRGRRDLRGDMSGSSGGADAARSIGLAGCWMLSGDEVVHGCDLAGLRGVKAIKCEVSFDVKMELSFRGVEEFRRGDRLIAKGECWASCAAVDRTFVRSSNCGVTGLCAALSTASTDCAISSVCVACTVSELRTMFVASSPLASMLTGVSDVEL